MERLQSDALPPLDEDVGGLARPDCRVGGAGDEPGVAGLSAVEGDGGCA